MKGQEFIFGMDGGGTSSRLRLETPEGALLFRTEGGPTNLNARGAEAVEATIRGLFRSAYEATGISPENCLGGFAGNAGVDRPGDREPFARLVSRASGVSAPVTVGNDAEPALAGALGKPEGILLIAGTGSIAYGRSPSGQAYRAGGWGHLLGDEGSAFWIAFQAIIRGMRSAEGRDLPTSLLEAALEFFSLGAPGDFVPFVYIRGLDKTAVARFARVVSAKSEEGDALAADIFGRAAEELSLLIASVAARLGVEMEEKPCAFRGGLIESNAWLRNSVLDRVSAKVPGFRLVQGGGDATEGACILARTALAKRKS